MRSGGFRFKLRGMSILTVEIPDEAMDALQRAAQSRGQEVAAFVREWAQSVSQTETHPLMALAGITTTDAPDLAARHDFYLAEEIMNTHADEK